METISRVQFYSSFIEMAEKQWVLAKTNKIKLHELFEKLSELQDDHAVDFEISYITPAQEEINSCSSLVIILCALAVEGYIYDYAARNLSDNFAEDIDKLDAVGKWLVVPQLVTGKKFPKDGKAYQLLKQLVSDRNYIVHPKSADFLIFDQKHKKQDVSGKAKRMQEFINSLFDKAQNAISTLDELALVMEELDPNEFASFFLRRAVGKRKELANNYGI